MKKFLSLLVIFLIPFASHVRADDTGAALAAGAAAGIFTGLATSAIVNSNSSRPNRAEAKADKAREETEMLRREQDRERVEQLRREQERRELERKDEQIRQMNDHLRHIERQAGSGTSPMVLYMLFGFILMLTTAVGVLALLLFRNRR